MSSNKIKYYLLTLSLINLLGQEKALASATLSTEVNALTKVNWLLREERPSIFLRCSGDKTNVYEGAKENTVVSSNNIGNLNNAINSQAQSHSTHINAQQVRWHNSISADNVLNVQFTKTTEANPIRHRIDNSGCLRKNAIHKVVKSDVYFSADATFEIPEDTWIVKIINKTQAANVIVSNTINNVYSPKNTSLIEKDINTALINNQLQYYFVKPKELMNITVMLGAAGKDIGVNNSNFTTNMEIHFIGSFQCNKIMYKYGGRSLELFKRYLTSKNATPDGVIEYLGCVTAKPNLDYMKQNTTLHQVTETLNELKAYQSNIDSKLFSDSKAVLALDAAIKMATLNLSNSMLVDIKKYCEVVNYSNARNIFNSEAISAHIFTALVIEKIKASLALINTKSIKNIHLLLSTIGENQSLFSNTSDKAFNNKVAYNFLRDSVRGVMLAKIHIDEISNVKLSERYFSNINKQLELIFRELSKVSEYIKGQNNVFSFQHKNDESNIQLITKRISQSLYYINASLAILGKDFNYSDNNSEFIGLTEHIVNEYFTVYGKKFSEDYDGFFKKYLIDLTNQDSYENLIKYFDNNSKEVMTCITNY